MATKAAPMANAVRATITVLDAEDLAHLIQDAKKSGLYVPARLVEAVEAIRVAACQVRSTRAAKRAEREAIAAYDRGRRERERHFLIGGFSILAVRGDYVDVSTDPDTQLWVDYEMREFLNRPIPDQSEIRRDCWLVRVCLPIAGQPTEILGSDCTPDANVDAAHAVANRIISKWQASDRAQELAA